MATTAESDSTNRQSSIVTGEIKMRIIKVLIVDDNDRLIQSAKNILANERDIEVIGEVRDGKEAILKAKEFKPDIVLMDVRMPGMNGLAATRELRQIMPEVKTIIFTIYDIDEYRDAATTSGACGFILKKSMRNELTQTIRRAFESRNV